MTHELATVVQWDRDTFTNVVDLHGEQLTNVPVVSGVEALTYRPGDMLMVDWLAGRRVILGRALNPPQAAVAS